MERLHSSWWSWSVFHVVPSSILLTGGSGGDKKADEIPNGDCLAVSFFVFQVPIELQTGH